MSSKLLTTVSTDLEAEFIKQHLASNEIQCDILSQRDSSFEFTFGDLAIVKIFVDESEYEKAKNILDEKEEILSDDSEFESVIEDL